MTDSLMFGPPQLFIAALLLTAIRCFVGSDDQYFPYY